MYINKLFLKEFGKFNNREIKLEQGLNVLYGDEGAGKSTVRDFVTGILFGINKSRGLGSGRIVDYGIQDSFNMGAAMAPAACDVIYNHLMDFERRPEDYDAIYTGDLGSVGQTILIDLMDKRGFDISNVHHDCGLEIYDAGTQDTHAGGSGCGCSAATLSAQILRRIREGEYSRVLFVPTGALQIGRASCRERV